MISEDLNGLPSEAIALCPLDGRYSGIRDELAPYFSEYALVKARVWVEVHWLKFLLENIHSNKILDAFPKERIPEILSIYESFSAESFADVKDHEARINHDVKSVELFIDDELHALGMDELISFVHIGCTSEDITNIAYASLINDAFSKVWISKASKLIQKLADFTREYADVPMLAHTHGQPAPPTTVGKEFAVFTYRLGESLTNIFGIDSKAKFNGATGNYSAISIAFPGNDWSSLSHRFVENDLGLTFNPVTTQIESHDYMCHLFDGIRHFNNVMLDLACDMWLYISKGYFGQKAVKGEVGSSTMPHKVNPIKFENAEANIDVSNALFMALSNKLPVSRMQRDLSDSSSQRDIGIAFGYSLQAIEQLLGGLNRVTVNKVALAQDLDGNWEVLAEPIQTALRAAGNPDAYNELKELTRGRSITKQDIQDFIKSCDDLSPEAKDALLELTPESYTGYASKIAIEVANIYGA